MRDYGRVFCALWASHDFRGLSEDGRALVVYLLTSPHGTMVGAFSLPDGYICEDIQWTTERVGKGFAELCSKGFANRCVTTKWAWIRKYLEWNPPENPNQWVAARKLVAKIPEQCSWRSEFQEVFAISAGDKPPPAPNPSGTVTPTVAESGSGSGSGSGVKNVPQGGTAIATSESGPPGDDPVGRVFGHWKSEHRHPKARLDDKRRRLIRTALKNYPESDLCQAISGYKKSAHHMGQNETKTKYDDIENMLRDAKHIDMGLKFLTDTGATSNGLEMLSL